MTAPDRPPRDVAVSAAGVAVGVASIGAWLLPGAIGMVAAGLAGTAAVVLGTIGALAAHGELSRRVRATCIVAVTLGLVGLAGVWVTAALVAAIPD